MHKIGDSELIVNPDGSIYHLKLRPEHIADTILIAGDQKRVEVISQHFDKIEFKGQNREFVTHTGTIGNKRITALSTGIGTDNIDIVLNELDALVNIDLKERQVKNEQRSLNIIRIGTSGSLQRDIPVDSFLLSTHGLGFDGLMNFYNFQRDADDEVFVDKLVNHCGIPDKIARPYLVKGSQNLIELLKEGTIQGVTATAPGFYAPQGRQLRLKPAMPDLNEKLTSFEHKSMRITNFEMETSALFGLSKALGHEACTVCAIIANRLSKSYSKDYKKTVEKLVKLVLERITKD